MPYTMDFDAPAPVKSPLSLVQLIPPLAKAKEVLFTVDGEYIFDVATTASAVAVSASNHQIKIYDAQLSLQGCLTGHSNTISAIQFHPNDVNLLFSAAQDGKAHCWDLRTPAAPVSSWSAPNRRSLLSLSVSPSANLLATGTELVSDGAFIHFFDLRAPALQHSFTESLADDVTQLSFHPNIGNRLLSGSTDGIACVFDLNTWDEDEDLVGSMQSGSSVHKLGWFGPAGEYVWMTTHTETVALWSAEGDLVKDFGDIRRYSSEEVPINYAVGFKYDEASQRLYLVTGSHDGTLSILHVTTNELQLCFSSGHAHTDVIRTFAMDVATGSVIAGGEDSRLSLWRPLPGAPQVIPANAAVSSAEFAPSSSSSVAGASKAFRGSGNDKPKKATPYGR